MNQPTDNEAISHPHSTSSTDEQKGICISKLADLPEKTILDTVALADALGVTTRTIRRMVSRFEICPPFRLRGRSMWFAGKVLSYIEAQADRLSHDAEKRATKIRRLT